MLVKFKVHQKYINKSIEDPSPEYVCVGRDFDAKHNKHFVLFRNAGALVVLFVKHHKTETNIPISARGSIRSMLKIF